MMGWDGSSSHPNLHGSNLGGSPVTELSQYAPCMCALVIFNSSGSSVGGRLLNAGGLAVSLALSVFLIQRVSLQKFVCQY